MSNRTRSGVPLGFLVLAALALFVLLVQPICDVHDVCAGDPAACSTSIADAALDDFADAPPVYKPSQAVPTAEVSSAAWRAAAPGTAVAAPPDHPAVSLPYHARSARILS